MALGPAVYKMVFDSRNFLDGVILTRKEVALQKQILQEVRPAVEDYGGALDQMANLVRKGALSVDEYNAANRALRAEFPENAAGLQLINDVMAEGETVRQSLRTEDDMAAQAADRHMAALAANEAAFRDNAQSAEEYREKLERLLAVSPEAIAAEERRRDAMVFGKQILQELKTEEERYAEARAKAADSLAEGAITEDQFYEYLDRLSQKLPSVIAEEKARADAKQAEADAVAEALAKEKEAEAALQGLRDRGAAIAQRNLTIEEQVAKQMGEADELRTAGVLSERDHAREMERLRRLLPEVAAAERAHTDEMNRAKMLTEQYEPAVSRARRELAEITKLYHAGKVPIESYRNAQMQLGTTIATGIPGLGQLASSLTGMSPAMLALGPAGIVAAAAFAAVTAGASLAKEAIDFTVDAVADQIKAMDDAQNKAANLGITANEYERLAFAADIADVETQAFSSGMEKMLGSVSKAADGNAKLGKVFQMLGLDADRLRQMNAPQSLEEIMRALEALPTQADKVRAATAIFGSPDFLRMDTAELERANGLIDDLGVSMREAENDEFDRVMKELDKTWESMTRRLAIEVLPGMTDLATSLRDFLADVNRSEAFTAFLENAGAAAKFTADYVRTLRDDVDALVKVTDKAVGIGSALDVSADVAIPGLPLLREFVGSLWESVDAQKAMAEYAKPILVDQTQPTGPAKSGLEAIDQESVKAAESMLDDLEKRAEKLRESIDYPGMSADEITLLKLAESGASQSTRDHAAALSAEIAEYERQQKALADSEKALQDQAAAEQDAARKREQAVSGILGPIQERQAALGLDERQLLANKLAAAGATDAERQLALATFDSIEAFETRDKAAKKAESIIGDLDKQIRQASMTPNEKVVDDLRVEGVSDAELQKIAGLQEELSLRKAIADQSQATSFVLQRNSREEAEAISKATKAAEMRLQMLEMPPKAFQLPEQLADPLHRPERLALDGPRMGSAVAPIATASERITIIAPPPVAAAPKQMVVPAAGESLVVEQRRTNGLMATLIDATKANRIEVQEVTL